MGPKKEPTRAKSEESTTNSAEQQGTIENIEKQLQQLIINTTETNNNIKRLEENVNKSREDINNIKTTIQKNHEDLKTELQIVDQKAKDAHTLALENQDEIKKLIDKQKNLNEEIKQDILKSINMPEIQKQLKTLDDENEDLRNRSMRSTLIFRGVRETEKNDSWEETSRLLVNILIKKLQLDPYECNMQISRAHRTPKSSNEDDDRSYCRPIFAQFVSWRYAEDVRKNLIKLHAKRKSDIIVSQMFSKNLTTRRNEAMKKRKELLETSPNLSIYLEYPAKLMSRNKNTRDPYELLEEF